MECRQQENLKRCTCTYPGCDKKGVCCECIAYHLKMRELPGCMFSIAAEKSYDRSFDNFISQESQR